MYSPPIHNNDEHCETINDIPFCLLSNNGFGTKINDKNSLSSLLKTFINQF